MRRVLATIVTLAFSLHAEAATYPNVIVFLADDLGFKDVGCYGGPVKTPHIDSLAASGARFTDFYSGCAVCSPSRATLLTGRHHIRTGVYSWISDDRQNSHLLEREVTLAEILKAAGFQTAHIGKWHLGLPTAVRKKPTPSAHGFDHWFATANNASPSHHNPVNFIRNDEPVGKLEGYSCQLVADEALQWLDNTDDDKPFFMNIWFHEPHAPIAAPENLVTEYGENSRDKAAVYSGTIDNTDRAIGRILNRLRERGSLDDTLIIYASDNGSYRSDRVGDLRGKKGVNWDGGIRVPGIFVLPGRIHEGQIIREPAGLVDVLPTVCELLGLSKPKVHLDGADLTPLLAGVSGPGDSNAIAPEAFSRQQPLWWHLQKSRPIVAMRDGDYSIVAEPDYELSTDNMFDEAWIPTIKTGSYHKFQLFNLVDDPGQSTDLASTEPDRLEAMKAKLLEINDSVMADGTDWHLDTNQQNQSQ